MIARNRFKVALHPALLDVPVLKRRDDVLWLIRQREHLLTMYFEAFDSIFKHEYMVTAQQLIDHIEARGYPIRPLTDVEAQIVSTELAKWCRLTLGGPDVPITDTESLAEAIACFKATDPPAFEPRTEFYKLKKELYAEVERDVMARVRKRAQENMAVSLPERPGSFTIFSGDVEGAYRDTVAPTTGSQSDISNLRAIDTTQNGGSRALLPENRPDDENVERLPD